jgi:hypothetical protein
MHVEFANNDNCTSSRDVGLIVERMKDGQLDYVILEPGVPLTSHDHAAPFRQYVHQHYCLKQSFLIGPNKFVEELWGRC